MTICVIGLGSMGRRRIRLLKKIMPDSIFVGVDSKSERVQEVSEKYQIKCYHSLEEINFFVDCAFVCTSPQFHGSIINKCLQNGSHIFSEINLIDTMYWENIQLAKEKQKVLFLSSTPMYKEEMRFVDKKIKQNGKVCIYQYHVGQYLPDWHPWDNLNDFFASNKLTNGCREFLAIELPWIQHVFGKIKNVNTIKRSLTHLGFEFPDAYLIQIEHENGNAGNLLIDVVSRQAVRQMEVMGEDIYIKWNGTPDSLYDKDILTGELKPINVGVYVHEKGYAEVINEYAYEKEIEEFFEVIQGKTPIYDFEQDIEILKIIDEIES